MQNSLQPIKLFDRKFVAITLRNTRRCPKCRSEYSHNYDKMMGGDSHVKSNRPFLLSCGHNMCENCVYQHRQNLICSVCMRPIQIALDQYKQFSHFHVREYFDMNFYILGEVNHLRFFRRDSSTNNTMLIPNISHNKNSVGGGGGMSSFLGSSSSPAPDNFVQKCNECELMPALGACRHCKVYYCRSCFDGVHKHSKVLKTHSLTHLDKSRRDANRMHMPKPVNCRRHRRLCDKWCRKCRLICCILCAKEDHLSHGWTALYTENERMKDDILNVLETVKMSRESLRKAQKDVKAVETQLEEYATQTFEDISNFFLQLHSFLQNEERRITDEFQIMCLQPQSKVRETYNKLSESQVALNTMRSNLEFYQHKPPVDIHLFEVINTYNTQLEHLQCQVLISKVTKNPFVFEPQRDMRKDFANYYRYAYNDPKITMRIGPMYGDLNRSFQDTQTFSSLELDLSLNSIPPYNTEEHKLHNNKRNQQKKRAAATRKSNSSTAFATAGAANAVTSPAAGRPMHLSNAELLLEPLNSPAANVVATGANKKPSVPGKNNYLARICHIKSPEQFFIQREESVRQVRELSNKYVNFTHQDTVPKSIAEGHYYMTYHVDDKQWYRAMVKKILTKDLYRLFLVDLGIVVDLPNPKLCDIDDKSLAIPFAAIRCALHDIMPSGKTWNKEANDFLIELTHNKPVRISIFEQLKDNSWKVDLFTTHTAEPLSVRDSFLYTGLARERPGEQSFRLMPKKMSPVARINQRLPKWNLQLGEMLTVKLTHIEDPQEFYVIKVDTIESKKTMWEELNHHYGQQTTSQEVIYMATLQMCGAVCLKDVWHRACVEEIKDDGNILVRLVDEGSQELVHWRKFCELHPKFRQRKEYAIKCSLADIEPLQVNNYAWTDAANKEFRQLASNPTLQLAICSGKQGEYKVTLHVSKKLMDFNVGAVLVKYGHGLSTGEATQVTEIYKTSPKKRSNMSATVLPKATTELDELKRGALLKTQTSKLAPTTTQKAANEQVKAVANTARTLKRTAIKVVHIVNPSEFYIQLSSLIAGITNFHKQIQQAQTSIFNAAINSPLFQEQKEWFVGDHCLVFANYKASVPSTTNLTCADSVTTSDPSSLLYEQCELYRGIIVSIAYDSKFEHPFVVFLRDIGVTLHSISRSQLYSIDHEWDRVTNGVYRCHLACVEHTGGMPSWSNSAIDYFKHSCASFEKLSVTLQGKRASGSNSLPIVLWGTTIETSDPLAPCITKHSNINRILVKAGLAHLLERIDITLQMDRIIQSELAEGEITLDEWFKNFSENAVLKAIERTSAMPANDRDNNMSYQLLSTHADDGNFLSDEELPCELEAESTSADIPPPEAWLRSKHIDKSIFTAFPTYVDYDCVLYLHDADDHPLLDKMRTKIMKAYGQKQLSNELEVVYSPGQACIAMYHLDSLFYRGIVQDLNPDGEYNVLFIDYGNVESIEPSHLRPYAPFPNMPTIASKYRLEGIRPKNGEKCYSTNVLDCIHKTIVDKHVSVRVSSTELSRPITMCSVRIGAVDLGQFLINEGLVAADIRLPVREKAEGNKRRNPLTSLKHNVLVPLHEAESDGDDEDFYEQCMDNGELDFERPQNKVREAQNKIAQLDNDDDEDDGNTEDEVNYCLDQLLHGRHSRQDMNLGDTEMMSNDPHQHTFQQPPPPKKRMFEQDDYTQMHAQMQFDSLYDNYNKAMNDEDMESRNERSIAAALGIDDDDQDIVELEHSFALNYWHADMAGDNDDDEDDNVHDNDDEEVEDMDKRMCALPQPQLLKTRGGFEAFHPNETSSVFSHFSGIDSFKRPQLPVGIRNFNCTVVIINTPTILQIYPLLTEFEFREIELHRRIKHVVKTTPPLTQFEPRGICLACYSKDKKWYRALIRTYNPAAKEADVFYVDYLNVETVSVKFLKQCPKELLDWPLRTFRVRLHGLVPNPLKREKDVRQALYQVVGRRSLFARVKKEAAISNCITTDELFSVGSGGSSDDTAPAMEVVLYESAEMPQDSPIYEKLIVGEYYNRI